MVPSSSTRARDGQHAPRHLVIGAIGALTLAVAACTDVTAPLPREGAPETLSFSRESWGTPGLSWTMRGDTVVFERVEAGMDGSPERYVVRVVPTPEAWRAFWSAAENAGVPRWRGFYEDESWADGESWAFVLETPRDRIEARGYQAYPDARGRKHKGVRTEAFSSLLSALYALVGEPL